MTNTMKTDRMLSGREVLVAEKIGDTVYVERLLNLADQYGTMTEHGLLWKPSQVSLDMHLRFIFGVKTVTVVRQTLVA